MEGFHHHHHHPYPFLHLSYHRWHHFRRCTFNTTSWMNIRIWSKLPERLIDRILVLLLFSFELILYVRDGMSFFNNSFIELYLQVSPDTTGSSSSTTKPAKVTSTRTKTTTTMAPLLLPPTTTTRVH
ncbi:uncharacterized protein DS421_17g601580 [Arachis hypogaea]|nr:uncharacterized protein DS421_17g601580 [Arachis hypogaea]